MGWQLMQNRHKYNSYTYHLTYTTIFTFERNLVNCQKPTAVHTPCCLVDHCMISLDWKEQLRYFPTKSTCTKGALMDGINENKMINKVMYRSIPHVLPQKNSTSNMGFGVNSGLRTSLPGGARSSIFTKLSAASCCSSVGWDDDGKLLKDRNWNSLMSSANGSTLK